MNRIDFISVIILTKDEEEGIAHTLSHLRAFDDVVLVDSNSADATVEIAEKMGARVVPFTWDGRYPKKKQWSLENAGVRNDWVLLLDADEYPSETLIAELTELKDLLSAGTFSAFDIHLAYRFAGRILRHGHVVTKRSLLNLTAARFPVVDDLDAPGIREVEGHYQPVADRRIGRLRSRLIHDDRDPVTSWFARHNRYSDWEAHLAQNRKLREEIASKRTLKGRVFDALPFKPALFFAYAYLARLGFLDGRPGFDYAVALTMYYWQIGVKSRELSAARTAEPQVVQIANTLARADGGPAHHAVQLNIALNDDGTNARLLYARASSGATTFDDAAASGRRLPKAPRAMASRTGLRTLSRADVWIIHGYYLPWVPLVVVAGRLRRKELVLMPHGSLTAYDRKRSVLRKQLFDLLFGGLIDRSVHFAVATPIEAGEAARHGRRISVVGAGVDVGMPIRRDVSGPWHLVTLSRIAEKKRIDRAIDVLAELRGRRHDVHLTIAGEGSPAIHKELRKRVESLGLEDHVLFVGHVHGRAKNDLLAMAHVLLAPSEDENFGFGPIEALASGVPIVGTDKIASVSDIHPPAGYALNFEVETAANAVESIMANYPESSNAARAYAESRFSWSSVARRWATLIGVRW